MKAILILTIALMAVSCNLTKEERRMNRATKKLEKLTTKFPELKRTDTLQVLHTVEVPAVRVDTVHTITNDTVTVTKDRLTVRYKVDTILNTVWVDALCDTVFRVDTVRVECDTIQPVKYEATAKEKQKTDRWRTVALIFIAIAVVLGLAHWAR